ncbi:MAG TPA: hypothetical protein VJ044_09650, partial [Candidatus Hodarchaeales archaeon]|nr:hypothetical protein [Candidatus Hodarchaeales archaeon]
DGVRHIFETFDLPCDQILKRQPSRQGAPLLFRIVMRPFIMIPVVQIVPITSENQEFCNEITHYFSQMVSQSGLKEFQKLAAEPFLFYLTVTNQLVYVTPFYISVSKQEHNYFLCFVSKKESFFSIYQLLSMIRTRVTYTLLLLQSYLQDFLTNPFDQSIKVQQPKVQELVRNWTNLNQYLGSLSTNLLEEFIRSGIVTRTLTEEEVRVQLLILVSKFQQDFDKIIFAILCQQKLFFVGANKGNVQKALNALLTFYPHPSVVLWTEAPTDHLISGTDPDRLRQWHLSKSVIVDLDNNVVIGGEKNEYISALIVETHRLIRDHSVAEGRRFFLGKIASLFSILESLLETTADQNMRKKIHTILRVCPGPVRELMVRVLFNMNPYLASSSERISSKLPRPSGDALSTFL